MMKLVIFLLLLLSLLLAGCDMAVSDKFSAAELTGSEIAEFSDKLNEDCKDSRFYGKIKADFESVCDFVKSLT